MNRGFYLDDCMLLVGCMCLIAQTILLSEMTPNLYLFQPLQSTKISSLFNVPADISERWAWFEKCNYAFIAVAWTTIFSIKFSFLFFFRRLIDRLKGFIVYWRVVVAFNIVAWALSVCHPFISCPRFDLSAGKSGPSIVSGLQWLLICCTSALCTQGSLLTKGIILAAIVIALDIVLEIMGSFLCDLE